MLDLGWTELLLIGIVALIVVGPKDLPVMFRTIGRFTGRMRAMAREFTRAMDDAADASGAKDIARDLRGMSNPRAAATKGFRKATGLDEMTLDDLDEEDDAGETGQRPAGRRGDGATGQTRPAERGDTNGEAERPAMGPNTAALAERRAAEAKQRREDAARRANERSATVTRFGAETDAPETSPAPAPAEAAEAEAAASARTGADDEGQTAAPRAPRKQDRA